MHVCKALISKFNSNKKSIIEDLFSPSDSKIKEVPRSKKKKSSSSGGGEISSKGSKKEEKQGKKEEKQQGKKPKGGYDEGGGSDPPSKDNSSDSKAADEEKFNRGKVIEEINQKITEIIQKLNVDPFYARISGESDMPKGLCGKLLNIAKFDGDDKLSKTNLDCILKVVSNIKTEIESETQFLRNYFTDHRLFANASKKKALSVIIDWIKNITFNVADIDNIDNIEILPSSSNIHTLIDNLIREEGNIKEIIKSNAIKIIKEKYKKLDESKCNFIAISLIRIMNNNFDNWEMHTGYEFSEWLNKYVSEECRTNIISGPLYETYTSQDKTSAYRLVAAGSGKSAQVFFTPNHYSQGKNTDDNSFIYLNMNEVLEGIGTINVEQIIEGVQI